MKRRVMTLDEVRKEFDGCGICAIVSVTDMGFCHDGVTRWYKFTDASGKPAIYFKR